MLIDLKGATQPAIGVQAHWAYLILAMLDPAIFEPLLAAVVGIVADAITANPASPQISSREAGASVLEAIGPEWHAEFSRRFPRFPDDAARGLFGMTLWHYLAGQEERWCFSGDADPYGHGQNAPLYWRVRAKSV